MTPSDDLTLTQTNVTSMTKVTEKKTSPMKLIAWVLLFILCLAAFTVLKLPQDQIKQLVEGHISAALAPKGMTFLAREGELNVGMGIRYTLKDISIISSQGGGTMKLAELSVAPKLAALFTGKLGAEVRLLQNADGKGSLVTDVTKRGNTVGITLHASQFDIGKSGLIAMLSPVAVQMQGELSGEAQLEGDFASPSTINGSLALQLGKVVLPEQNIVILNLPRLQINDGKIDADIVQGKVKPKNIYLGKAATDDLRANITGDMTLNKFLESSPLNLKINLGFSEAVLKALPLIGTFLTPVKQPDGTFLITVGGTFGNPMANILGGMGGMGAMGGGGAAHPPALGGDESGEFNE